MAIDAFVSHFFYTLSNRYWIEFNGVYYVIVHVKSSVTFYNVLYLFDDTLYAIVHLKVERLFLQLQNCFDKNNNNNHIEIGIYFSIDVLYTLYHCFRSLSNRSGFCWQISNKKPNR